jgi:hypothetical protein
MLSNLDYQRAALKLSCEVFVIMAVTQKEAGANGFYKSGVNKGKIKLKFEGHRFSYYSKRKFDKTHPTISYQSWTEKHWEEDAYRRFNIAFKLDPQAAMKATSWGMFQIMGEHYAVCGYTSVDAFVSAMQKSEANQLDAFCTFVIKMGYAPYLQKLPSNPILYAGSFALKYNGTGYKKNKYDTDIAALYLSFKSQNNL